MKITDIPPHYLSNALFHFAAPTMARVDEMLATLNAFGPQHHAFLPWSIGPHHRSAVAENMQEAMDNFSRQENELKFLIIDNQTQRLLGCISLFLKNPAIPACELGYWLAVEAEGRGVMTQACEQMTAMALALFAPKRLEITTAGRNQRSAAVALRCGYLLEARLKHHRTDSYGEVDDTLIYTWPLN
ncbi:GNAT family N-acetyltransferase [Pantoea sp. A4]|uniref:GNAT family N-acetyltransferase n=1 Tax=Pantoea sp. A4 TaxID=1225184 RepID=UPI000370F0CA|nr:GNAT family protein [Pantoea sp. A4]